jgi:hypothetical protein
MSESRKRYLAAVRRKKKKKKSNRKYNHTMNMIQPITAPIIVRIPNHDLPLQLLSTPITQITICVPVPLSLLTPEIESEYAGVTMKFVAAPTAINTAATITSPIIKPLFVFSLHSHRRRFNITECIMML